jgi:energy-converting hydrogenase Eha subunit C
MSAPAPRPREYAIRIAAIDDLFVPFDARSVAERPLRDDVRLWLLDEWELVRDARPSTLHVHAPATERVATDEQAVGVAVRADLLAHTRRLHHANPLNRRERIAVWAGVVIFLITIAVSTLLDNASTAVLVAGISQAIVVIGWVALWDPAQRVAGDIVPQYFLRKRYAEIAEIDVRFVWHDPPGR